MVDHDREALILRLPVVIAVIDLLKDHHQAEDAVDQIEIEVADFRAGALGVVRDHLVARQHPLGVAGLLTQGEEPRSVVGLDPIGHGVAEVHQRITERGHLPVEHRDDVERIVRVDEQIVDPEVAVDDAGAALRRDPFL